MVTGLKTPQPSRPNLPPPPSPNGVNEVEPPNDGHEAVMGFFDHLNELRSRLTKAVLALVIGTSIGALFGAQILIFLKQPYAERFTALGPTDSVVAYFRVSLLAGAILSIPIITYQLLMFILPGLTKRERRFVVSSLPAITILFLIGAIFAWVILIPPALNFLSTFQSDIFKAEWTADLYLSFVTALVFWMGVAFETPLVMFILSLINMVNAGVLIRNWRIAIIGAAVAAALITPTVDPVNMALVIVPLLALYVLSIGLVMIGSRINRAQAA